MSQAPEHGQVGPQGEQEHVSVHTEASSFTPQHEVPEPQVPQLNAVPQEVPYLQPQMAANMLQFLQQMAWEQRGDLAIALLQDAAYDWWKRAGANVLEPVPWATFDELFREEYVPEHFMEEKRDEFMKFTQGELKLPEYRQKFDELAEFGRDMVPTMERRCKRFREGLRPDLSFGLVSAPRNDINDLYKQALQLQAALLNKAEYEQAQKTHPRPPPSPKPSSSSKRPPPVPSSSHSSKKAGHFRRDCPTNPGEPFPTATAAAASAPAAQAASSQKSVAASSQPKRPAMSAPSGKAPSRTYAMHGRTEQPAHDVIMGMFTLFDTCVSALIDPGSTLSYLCTSMPTASNISRENQENPVVVSNPLGHSLHLKHIYSNCPLVVQGKSFPANLIELPHREFDIILGMDWLTANQAVVDCGAHTVRLKAEDGSEVLVHGELLPKAPEFISYIRKTLAVLRVQPTLLHEIETAQRSDDFCKQTCELASRGEKPDFSVREDGVLLYRSDPSHVIPADTVTLDENLSYEEEPVEILARLSEPGRLEHNTLTIVCHEVSIDCHGLRNLGKETAQHDNRLSTVVSRLSASSEPRRMFRIMAYFASATRGQAQCASSAGPSWNLRVQRVHISRACVGQRIMEPDPDDWVIGAADERQWRLV
ncbi:unnamed protein product [Cuscuta campestris]|uniref:Retrotransposon gag domain-containing protein n=1 Tax=Cuscuta campestris TaxID=132261 RepID=A0A484NBM4_9ASTE|nr:unnamed protein product [Cuscuta campestris]